jgi:aldehyde:ferredoxin oxidoreductase
MKEKGGYSGGLLVIDLGKERVSADRYPAEAAERYIGGFGVNNSLFTQFFRPGTEPFSPDNPIVLGVGPLVGTAVFGASRVIANSCLPLTGAVAAASGSMGMGANMKWAGWDHVVLTGRAPRPTVLRIDDGSVELLPADGLWGMGTLDATRRLWRAYPGHSVLAIGPAGESLAHSALAMIDACATLGRGGLASVFGSKNIKAVAVKGSGGVVVADPKRLDTLLRGLLRRLADFPMRDAARELGMIGAWAMYVRQLLPHGASEEDIQDATERFGPRAYLGLKKRRIACPSCFLADKDELCLPSRKESVYSTSFLNAAILGCAFLMKDAAEAADVLALLDDLGLDFMTLTNQASFLLELRERGVIDEKDAEGVSLSRGAGILRELAIRITERKGEIGKALAGGWTGTLEYFGEETRRYAILVRNQDCLYDPRATGLGTMEFEQVVSPRGPTSATAGSATYMPGLPQERLRRLTERMGVGAEALGRIFSHPAGMNVGRLTRYSEDWFSLFSSLGLCNRYQINRFYNGKLVRDILEAVTGVSLEVREMMGRAAGAWELYRGLNARQGLGTEADIAPEAWFSEKPMWGRGGRLTDYFGNELSRTDVRALLEDYYDERARKPG